MKQTFSKQVFKTTLLGMGMICLFASVCQGALSLTGTSYTQDFNSIGGGLPTGWSVNTAASDTSLGTAGATYASGTTSWVDTTGEFKNVASYDSGLASGSTTANQALATDRALGIRQTGAFGDPGAAFVLDIQNTTGLNNFSLSVELQMLSVQGHSTTWSVQYGLGSSPSSFTTLGTFSDPGTFGSTTFTANSTDFSALNDQSQEVWIRIAALSASTGSGSRDTFGIDNFTLNYSLSAVPEPATWGVISALGLLGICGIREWRQRKQNQAV